MRADRWVMDDLLERLIADWYNLFILTEYDLQVATYYWLRRYFQRTRSEQWSVRTQPTLDMGSGNTSKPDIVVFKNTLPYDVFELKCHLTGVRADRWEADLDKLHQLKNKWNIRHAYQLVLHDDDEVWGLPRAKESWAKRYLTFVGANVRRHETGRMRRDYEQARGCWERWRTV